MRHAFFALVLLLSLRASAQAPGIFSSGPPPVFREELADKRFLQTKLYKALNTGTDDPGCAQLMGALLTLVGETAPTLHQRDENFYLDPYLVQVLSTQASTPRFPANAYFVAMMRRVLIDKKLPEEWLNTANSIAPYYPALDMAKLKFLSEGIKPIDSFLLTLPVLRERYEEEVKRANTTAADTAESLFRDTYLDHEVTFGGLELVDAKLVKPPKPKKKRKGEEVEPEPPYIQARLTFALPDPNAGQFVFTMKKKPAPPVVQVNARLLDKQYLDLARLPKGTRLLVRGRLWDYKKAVTEIEIRDALLFQDREWKPGTLLANPQVVATCPLTALNDLTGIAPNQPGAFGSH